MTAVEHLRETLQVDVEVEASTTAHNALSQVSSPACKHDFDSSTVCTQSSFADCFSQTPIRSRGASED